MNRLGATTPVVEKGPPRQQAVGIDLALSRDCSGSMPPTPALADVAAVAKCSIATVSLALRGDPRVAPATRRRVAAAATRVGYVPNPALAALAVRRWGGRPASREAVIAVVTMGLEPARLALGSTYYGEPELVAAVQGRASELGYRVELHRFDNYDQPATLKRILLARGIAGILLTGAHAEPAATREFIGDFASVTFGLSFAKPFTHAVESDWAEGVQQIFRRLKERGYRRIGVVLRRYSLREKQDTILSRVLLERDVMTREFGSQPSVALLGADEAGHERQVREWLERERPDAVVASNNVGYRWLGKAGQTRRLPAFVSLYNQGHGSDLRLSCLHHSQIAEGREAVDLLDHLLRYRLTGVPRYPTVIRVAPTWREGRSTPTLSPDRPPPDRRRQARTTCV